MAKRTSGRSSAPSSKGKKKRWPSAHNKKGKKQARHRPDKQAGNRTAAKRRGGNPPGKGHRSSTTWQTGQSGNYKGRPKKGDALSEIAIARMNIRDVRDDEGKKLSRKVALVEMVYSKAIRRADMVAFREMREMLSHAGDEVDKPQTTEAAVYQGVLALFREVGDKHPELKEELLNALKDARSGS